MGRIKDLRWTPVSIGNVIQLEVQYQDGKLNKVGEYFELEFFIDPFALSDENILIRDRKYCWFISDCLKVEDLIRQLKANK